MKVKKNKKVAVKKSFVVDPNLDWFVKENKQKIGIAKAIKRCIRKKFKFDNAKMVNSYFKTWNGRFYDGLIYVNEKEFFLDRVTIMAIKEIKKEG